MTSTQFYIGIAVPSILVILGWLHQNTRLSDLRSDVNRQFDRMDGRLDRMDGRLDLMDERLRLIEGDQKQFFTVTGKLDGRIDELSRK